MKSKKSTSHTVYYFTGTGNSLFAARMIAGTLKADLVSIPAIIDRTEIVCNDENMVIVFPCYLAQMYGIPLIIERFAGKLKNMETKRISAVCTYGCFGPVNALPTLKNLSKLVASLHGRLYAGFSVRLPLNNLDYDHVPVPLERDSGKIIERSRKKIDRISNLILSGRRTRFTIVKGIINLVFAPMYALTRTYIEDSLFRTAKTERKPGRNFRDAIPLTDNGITVNDECTGCGLCERICPVRNIRLIDKKPVWQNHCEMCFACDEWCPVKAIHHWGKFKGKDYHHPETTVRDMLRQRETAP